MDSKDGETNVELMQVVVRAGPGSVPSRSTRSSSDAVDSSTPRKKGSKETKPSVSRMKMFEEYKKMPGSISLASGTNSKRSSASGTERASEKMKTKKRKNKDYTIRVGSREDSQGSSIKKLEKLRTEGRRDSLAVNKIGTRVQARRKTVDEEAKQISECCLVVVPEMYPSHPHLTTPPAVLYANSSSTGESNFLRLRHGRRRYYLQRGVDRGSGGNHEGQPGACLNDQVGTS